jgi:hypothetical protein
LNTPATGVKPTRRHHAREAVFGTQPKKLQGMAEPERLCFSRFSFTKLPSLTYMSDFREETGGNIYICTVQYGAAGSTFKAVENTHGEKLRESQLYQCIEKERKQRSWKYGVGD